MLLSYAKIALQQDLLESGVPDEPQLEPWLTGYFPPQLRERFAGDIARHSLRREIIALGLTNAIVNRGGPAMAVRLADETRARQRRCRAMRSWPRARCSSCRRCGSASMRSTARSRAMRSSASIRRRGSS